MQFSDKLRFARKQAGLTQKELADILGVSMRTITNYEAGERYPKKRETYTLLAETLNLDVNYLLTEDELIPYPAKNSVDYPTPSPADLVCSEITRLFCSNQLSDEEIDDLMQKVMDIYWTARRKKRRRES